MCLTLRRLGFKAGPSFIGLKSVWFQIRKEKRWFEVLQKTIMPNKRRTNPWNQGSLKLGTRQGPTFFYLGLPKLPFRNRCFNFERVWPGLPLSDRVIHPVRIAENQKDLFLLKWTAPLPHSPPLQCPGRLSGRNRSTPWRSKSPTGHRLWSFGFSILIWGIFHRLL
jgi:hypothetical protein